jgi:flagellar hook-associated protein 2
VGLRFDSSGGQFNSAIKQIMDAERQPVKQLEGRKGKEETRLKLFGEFKGKFTGFDNTLAQFSNFNRFKEYKVDLGDGATQAAVTIEKEKVQPGSYSIEIAKLANSSSIISNGFEDADKPILGTGYVTVQNSSGEKEEIYVGGKSASLRGVANLINSKSDSSIRASVIKDSTDPEEPWRLIVTAKKDGLDDEVFFPEFYFLDGEKDLRVERDNEASNAVIKVDGFEIEADGNKIPDFLTGVTLDLKQAKEGQAFTLNITEDIGKVAGKVKGLTDQINGILEFINKQNQVDDKSDSSTGFAGDTSLQTIEYRIRNLLHEGFPVWDNKNDPDTPRFVHLNQIGIEFDKKGMLSFKEEKFTKALERDFNGIGEAISGDHGFAIQLRQVMANYTRPGNGLLAMRENGMKGRIAKIDRDIEVKERGLERKKEMLTQKFSRLQSTLSGMQQQQQYMQASMGGGGGNLISQLMGG